METENQINPYEVSSVADVTDDGNTLADETQPRLSLLRTAQRWFLVCGISCVPSFTLGMTVTSSPAMGMATGVILFAIGYTFLDFVTANSAWRQDKRVKRTLKISYGTRIAVSVILPIGMFLDILCATISVPLCSGLLGTEDFALETYSGAVLTTLVQGAVMNCALAVYALAVHGIQLAILWLDDKAPNR